MEALLWAILGAVGAMGACVLVLLARTFTKADPSAALREGAAALREEVGSGFRDSRQEAQQASRDLRQEVGDSIGAFGQAQHKGLESLLGQLQHLADSNRESLDKLRDGFTQSVTRLQESNEKKLDQMREVVDEKLQSTLERRLGESFKLVSDRLEAVHDGLGEMRKLASDVGDLSRVLGNVKTRGTFGEAQLGALLEQVLSPAQYATNVETRAGSNKRIEYAVRLPGADAAQEQIWLPIDSKFPMDDYMRLVEAEEKADVEGVRELRIQLARAVRNSAKMIREKYVEPPHTTPFGILFLPAESLYAEILRSPGLVEELQDREHILVTGPTTLFALLNSLRVGFRTLAIQERSAEVWRVLGAVKTEFGKFAGVLDKVSRQLRTASSTLEESGKRTRAMERKLRDVEEISAGEAVELLGLAAASGEDVDDG